MPGWQVFIAVHGAAWVHSEATRRGSLCPGSPVLVVTSGWTLRASPLSRLASALLSGPRQSHPGSCHHPVLTVAVVLTGTPAPASPCHSQSGPL